MVIILVKGTAKNAVQIADVNATLAVLRPVLESKELMLAGDRFLYQGVGDIPEVEEVDYKISDAFSTVEGQKQLSVRARTGGPSPSPSPAPKPVPAEPKSIIVGRGARKVKDEATAKWFYQFVEKWSCQIPDTESLASLRTKLEADKGFNAVDLFLIDGASISRKDEGRRTVKEAILGEKDGSNANVILAASESWS